MSKLSIPEDISLERRYMPGIGKQELKWLLMTAMPGLVVTIVAWFTTRDPIHQLIIMGCGVGYMVCCYGVFAKVDNQQSIFVFISKIIRFWKSQKKYFYQQEREVLRFVDDKK